jgi:hypothetical protein
MEHGKQIPIWFFIGVLLTLYGILIIGAGIHAWISPPSKVARVALWNLHADVWWGVLLVAIGTVYVTMFRPGRAAGKQATSDRSSFSE